jgi:hypothetical protein
VAVGISLKVRVEQPRPALRKTLHMVCDGDSDLVMLSTYIMRFPCCGSETLQASYVAFIIFGTWWFSSKLTDTSLPLDKQSAEFQRLTRSSFAWCSTSHIPQLLMLTENQPPFHALYGSSGTRLNITVVRISPGLVNRSATKAAPMTRQKASKRREHL